MRSSVRRCDKFGTKMFRTFGGARPTLHNEHSRTLANFFRESRCGCPKTSSRAAAGRAGGWGYAQCRCFGRCHLYRVGHVGSRICRRVAVSPHGGHSQYPLGRVAVPLRSALRSAVAGTHRTQTGDLGHRRCSSLTPRCSHGTGAAVVYSRRGRHPNPRGHGVPDGVGPHCLSEKHTWSDGAFPLLGALIAVSGIASRWRRAGT